MNTVFRLTLAVVALALPIAAHAQTPKPTPSPEENTKLEKFQARTGAVIIKGFSRVGRMNGTGGAVSVLSMEFIDAQSGRKEQGIVIATQGSDRYDRENRSFIDYDEIDSLLKGIDYISKVEPTVTKLPSYEASYRTRGDFSVTTFNSSDGSINIAVSSGRVASENVYLKLSDLPNFRKLIVDAKEKLDMAK